jgi:hypothetical protein
MKKKQSFVIIVLVAVLLTAIPVFYLTYSNKMSLSESEAISLIKAAYPEFKNYPNDNLPPQTIQTKWDFAGWYVAFVQEGSGRPILEAKCFLVKDDKSVTVIGEYVPKVGDDRFDLSEENIFKVWIK